MCEMKLKYLPSLWIGIVFALLSTPSTVMGIILELDDKLVASDTYSVKGFSDTSLESIVFNVLNAESCSKLDQFVVTKPSVNQNDIVITQDVEKVC